MKDYVNQSLEELHIYVYIIPLIIIDVYMRTCMTKNCILVF